MSLSSLIAFAAGLVAGILIQTYVPTAVDALNSAHNRYVAWSQAKADQSYLERHSQPK